MPTKNVSEFIFSQQLINLLKIQLIDRTLFGSESIKTVKRSMGQKDSLSDFIVNFNHFFLNQYLVHLIYLHKIF